VTRSLPLRRTLAAAAISPLLLTGLAACGDDSSSDASGSGTTASGGGTQVLAGVSTGDHVAPKDFLAAMSDGAKALTTAHMTMDVSIGSAGSIKGSGDADYTKTPADLALKLTMPSSMSMGSGGGFELRLVDGIMYVSAGSLTGGKFWKLDPSDKNNPLGASGLGDLLDQMDPVKAVEAVRPAIEKVTFVGNEDVDGRSLDHYTLTVDPETALKSLGGGSMTQGAQGEVPDSLVYDVWLDDQGRTGKVSMDLPVGGSSTSLDINMTDFGEQVDIEAPSADQVTKMPDLGGFKTPPPAA
jgi:hypothetical protein